MQFTAAIDIMPHKELLDPQGKAVAKGLHNMGFAAVDNVRIGRHITLTIDAANEKEAEAIVTDACKKLLANAIMEGFSFTLSASK